jgi:two-component system sensor histidine kinase DegS
VQLVAVSFRTRKSLHATRLEAIHREAREAVQRVRRFSRALRPACLKDLGSLPALVALAGDVGSSLAMPAVMRAYGRPLPLSRDEDLAIYRIVQEALAFIAMHAAAHHVWINLRCRREELGVMVMDDGAGFFPAADTGDLSGTEHFGLIGMRARTHLLRSREGDLSDAPPPPFLIRTISS